MSKQEARIAMALENIALQLRRRNDQVESFQREVLGVLEKITYEGPSEAGATAQVVETVTRPCPVCGREGVPYGVCLSGELTREQWLAHHEDFYRESQQFGSNKVNAAAWADGQMETRFGPEPSAGPSQQEGEDR
jgi:hypothetical protein